MYSHSHADHFGGVKGVTTQEDVDAGRCVVIAPDGFLEHAVSENVYAGTAMLRRAGYMFGAALERGPAGQIGTGLGQTNSTGTVSLIAPTDTILATGETRVVDGIRMEFQVTPGTEAPAEMNTLFPDHGALWMAENATHVLHNILTIRGAVVRDARVWSRYLTEAIDLFGERMDVVFASHHWPTWGRERAVRLLAEQRDLYAYLHDQTLRMLNQGLNGAEIAEAIELPPALERAWHARGYYGSVSHNVKAIYQRYMGWYDGNPARLWQHTPGRAGEAVRRRDGRHRRRRRTRAGRVRGPRPALGGRAARPGDLRRPRTRRAHGSSRRRRSSSSPSGPRTGRGATRSSRVPRSSGTGRFGTPATTSPRTCCWPSRRSRSSTPSRSAWTAPGPGTRRSRSASSSPMPMRPTAWTCATASSSTDALLSMARTSCSGCPARPWRASLAGSMDGVAMEGDPAVLARLMAVLDQPDPGFAIVTP